MTLSTFLLIVALVLYPVVYHAGAEAGYKEGRERARRGQS